MREKDKLEKPTLREFTLIFKNKRQVKVVGTTVHEETNGFSIKTVAHGQERTAHWFSEKPIEWISRWL